MAVSVLVTRPAGQAEGLCTALAARGYHVLHQPLLELAPLQELPARLRQRLMDLDHYRHVIFISANAVRFGMDCIDDYWPQLPLGINWYAIGGTTAALLAERGLSPVTPGQQMNSEGLLAVPQLQSVSGERVLIVKGEGGRDTLGEVLSQRGALVDELPCYRRACPALSPGKLAGLLSRERVEAVLISSGEGLVNMLALLSEKETSKFRDMRLLVPSPRVAALACEAGFGQVAVARNASDDAMVQALQEWIPGDNE